MKGLEVMKKQALDPCRYKGKSLVKEERNQILRFVSFSIYFGFTQKQGKWI